MRTHLRDAHLLGLIVAVASLLAFPLPGAAQTPTCADYSSTAAAQFALDINPGLAPSLDPDGNGTACDDASGPTQAHPSSTELQLPTTTTQTPTPTATQPAVDVIDGQPATTTRAQGGNLDGRIGGSRAAFEAAHGQPIRETPSQANPDAVGVAYAGTGTIADLFVVYVRNQASIVWLTPAQPWTTDQAAAIIGAYVPTDVTTLPQPEPLADDTLLMPVSSQLLAGAVTQEVLTAAGLPGVPGDMYLLLTTDGGQAIVEAEIGIGNGDNVRDAAGRAAEVPVASTIASTASFLEQTRTQVDRYRAEITELRAILGQQTVTDADTARLTVIVVGWMAIDTAPVDAPPEHARLGELLSSVNTDLSTVGGIVFTVISVGDTSRVPVATSTLQRAEQRLQALDQQLTAYGV